MKTLLRTCSFLFLAFCCERSIAQPAAPEIVAGDLLVMPASGVSAERIALDLARVQGVPTGLRVVREVSAPMNVWLFHFDTTVPQEAMARALRAYPGVRIVQNNHVVRDRVVPDDAQYGQQWQHQNIDSEGAWDITTGGVTATGDTIVACIIERADLPHPDLIGNAWFNRQETPGNGVDDDGNGYVDDYQGWNPFNNNDDVYTGSHGTQVAGMIGAKGNNGSQVTGANWNVKLMVVARNGTDEANVISSYTYPLVMRRLYNSTNGSKGAFVVVTNASWGVDGGQPEDAPLWCAMYDTLGTAGILNCGATANNAVDVDQVGDLPTACASDFMVSVTATDVDDQRTFSAYGLTTIDVGAPGANIFTTSIGGGTGSTSGTSFASPLTAGVIALLYSTPCASMMSLVHGDPEAGALYVRQMLFNGVEQVGNLPGNTVTGGRINASNSVHSIMNDCGTCPSPYNLSASDGTLGSTMLSWSSTATDLFNVRYREVGAPDWTTINDVNAFSLPVLGLANCTPYEFQVEADCDSLTSTFGNSYTWTSEGCCEVPAGISVAAIDSNSAVVTWNTVLIASTYDLRYRPEGSPTWTTINGLSTTNTTLNDLLGCTNYEVQLLTTCNGSPTAWSNSALFHTPGCGQCVDLAYCESKATDASSEWIDRVQLNTLDNTSGNNNGYEAYTDQSTTLTIGSSYPITLTPGFGFFQLAEWFTVWIDLDGDGQFQAPQDLVYDEGEASSSAASGTLTVPATAQPGGKRMRVVMRFQNPVENGCVTNYDFGETEDYCITLQVPNGMEEQAAIGNFVLFPNPADEQLSIRFSGQEGDLLEVTDVMGQRVAVARVRNGQALLNTASLSNGTYFLRGAQNRSVFEVSHR